MRFLNVFVPCLISIVNATPRSDCKCGVENVDFLKARPRQVHYPWVVALFNADKRAFCSGALISDQHVLTDGKCVSKDSASPKHFLKIRGSIGIYDLKSGGKLEFDDVKIQPNHHNDIAILKLKKKVNKFSATMLPVCLPKPKFPYQGRALVNGYGTSDNRAKKMFGVILENEVELTKCKIKKEGTICAERRGVDTCSHDLGSPLFMKTSSGSFDLLGVATVSEKCGGKNQRIYSDIAANLQWIQKIISVAGVCTP